MGGLRHSAVLRTLPLSGSLNTAFMATLRSAQISPFGRNFTNTENVRRNSNIKICGVK